MGIPFAAPPIGKLRFEKPQQPIPWTKPINATAYSKGCIPCVKPETKAEQALVSEDFLYLNVWSPNLQNFARRGIVVVTIQYRLGPFGFLTLNDSSITPNLGLWDQVSAMQWIQENIGRFGGNSKQVTIMGESAGAESGCGPDDLNFLGFAPIVDGDFLPNQPEVSLKNVPKYPTILGLNQLKDPLIQANSHTLLA
ncbi:unnamed protein product, partial [Mesorhabditis belari]|uniref:Carboxylic ester hydrolase n=1 Tax=Mesorhabditis belari TaxID=2138241 RepID=A0AAF3EKW2_9BILA